MKKLLLCLAALGCTQFVFAQKNLGEMNSLNSIVNSSEFRTDNTRISYVLKRCSALYSVTGAVMNEKMGESKMGEELSKVGAMYADGSMQMDKLIQKSRNPQSKLTNDEWIKVTMDMINRISQLYIDEIKRSMDRTGNYFSEAYKSDMTICNNLEKYTKK